MSTEGPISKEDLKRLRSLFGLDNVIPVRVEMSRPDLSRLRALAKGKGENVETVMHAGMPIDECEMMTEGKIRIHYSDGSWKIFVLKVA